MSEPTEPTGEDLLPFVMTPLHRELIERCVQGKERFVYIRDLIRARGYRTDTLWQIVHDWPS